MIFQDEGPRTIVFCDNGPWEVAEFLNRPKVGRYVYESEDTDGGIDLDTAKRYLRDGWQKGADELHQLLAQLPFSSNASGVSHWKMDIAGDMPDVGRYVTGEPAHMRARNRQQGNKPTVHLLCNTALMSTVSNRSQKNYWMAVCGLIDWMESRGIRVELDRVGVVESRGIRSFQGWKIKRAEDALDLSALAFALGHPASHRQVVWGMRRRVRPLVWDPHYIRQADAVLIGAENAYLLNGVVDSGDEARTLAGACLLAAKRINEAAGEPLLDMAVLREMLTELRDEQEAKLRSGRL